MMSAIARDYERLWQTPLEVQNGISQMRGHIAQFAYVISFVDEPIDQAEMLRIAKHNVLFTDGEKIARHHRCHAVVGVFGVGSPLARYQVLTRLLAAVASAYNAVAVYLGEQQLFYDKKTLLEQAPQLLAGQLPTALWIYYGFYAHQEAFWVYTQGMREFSRLELEISSDRLPLRTLHEILTYLSAIVISNHHQFEDGEIIEVGDYCLSVTHRESPALKTKTLLFCFENLE